MSEYSIFKPKSARGIFYDYPELRKNKAFKALTNYEMLFVWYFACESSPHYRISSERDRVIKCIEDAFKNKGKNVSKEEFDKMLEGEFRPKIAAAIDEMLKFRVGPRVRAKKLTEKTFDNLEKILDIDASDEKHFHNKDGEVDFSKKKAFVDTAAKAQELMPKLISNLEGNFQVSEEKGKDEEVFGAGFADQFHENRD
jgi:hypothetical protein